MDTNEEPVLELLGKTGNPVKIKLFDININCKVKQNEKTGKFEPYVSRWYRLPGEYTDPTDAMNAILEFQKKYLL